MCPGQSPRTRPPRGIKEPPASGRCRQLGVWTDPPRCLDLHLLLPLEHRAPPVSPLLRVLAVPSLLTAPMAGCCCPGAGVSWTGHWTPGLVRKNRCPTGCPSVSQPGPRVKRSWAISPENKDRTWLWDRPGPGSATGVKTGSVGKNLPWTLFNNWQALRG